MFYDAEWCEMSCDAEWCEMCPVMLSGVRCVL